MNLEELEEELGNVLPGGFSIETAENGELIIRTGLREDDDGELVDFDGDDEDEEDEDADPDFEPLDDEDDDEE